jgi:hypothetical protein
VNILSTDFDGSAFGGLHHRTDSGERRADNDIDFTAAGAAAADLFQILDQCDAFGGIFIHFPVTGDNDFTAHFQLFLIYIYLKWLYFPQFTTYANKKI